VAKDLTEIYHQGQSGYPQFDLVVIRPQEFSTQIDESRREYLVDRISKEFKFWTFDLEGYREMIISFPTHIGIVADE
jgi:hypothetical protein